MTNLQTLASEGFASSIAVLMSAATAFAVYLLHRKRAPAEARKLEADTTKVEVEIATKLLVDLEKMREELAEAREREKECIGRLNAADDEFLKMSVRLLFLEQALPLATVSSKLRGSFESMRKVLDACRDGVVIAAPDDDGRFVYCNPAFASALGYDVSAVLQQRWQDLVHPDDLEETRAVEGNAWALGGSMTNRFLHADGHYVQLRWHFTNYDAGASFSIVWLERRRSNSEPPQG